MKNYIRWMLKITLFKVMRIFPIDQKKIVVSNFNGKSYGGEGKVVVDALLKNNREYKIFWLCNDLNTYVPEGVRLVSNFKLTQIYHLVTARIWIDNRRKDLFVRKRKGQFYIQTWHGDVGLKTVEKDAENTLSKFYVQAAKNDSKMIDVMLAASDWSMNVFKRSFWYEGPFLKCNLYVNKEKEGNAEACTACVKRFFGLSQNASLLLYAPTFRKDKSYDVYDIDYLRLKKNLELKYGGRWIILVRFHSSMNPLDNPTAYSDWLVDANSYPLVNDLIIASEFLITDYSSLQFEALRMNKKVLLYVPDMDFYVENDRKFNFDLRELPSKIAKNNESLRRSIVDFDEISYYEQLNTFNKKLNYYTDCGVEEVVRLIDSILCG